VYKNYNIFYYDLFYYSKVIFFSNMEKYLRESSNFRILINMCLFYYKKIKNVTQNLQKVINYIINFHNV
jgi:hypothetical protein